jgi:AcrR family transcriptional regulator
MNDIRSKLLEGTLRTIREQGVSQASAQTIAETVGVDQGLIFCYFETVDELFAAACRHGAKTHVDAYRERLAAVNTIRGLLDVARELETDAQAQANLTVLTQLLAGAQHSSQLAKSVAAGLNLWAEEIRQVLQRLLAKTPLSAVVDFDGLARVICSTFIGIELYRATDARGGDQAFATLSHMGALLEGLENLGPIAHKVVTNKVLQASKEANGVRWPE